MMTHALRTKTPSDQCRVCLPDAHIPFADQWVLSAWLDFVSGFPVTGVDILGDLLDAYPLSRFDKNPARRHSLNDEIKAARKFLETMRDRLPLTTTEVRYSEGNHEDRLRRLLWGSASALASLRGLSIPTLLGLDDLNISYHPEKNPYRIGDLWYMHGNLIRKHAGNSARAKSDQVGGSVLMGHSHRMGWVPTSLWTETLDAYDAGCVCLLEQEYLTGPPNWQQGWPVVTWKDGVRTVDFARVVRRGRRRVIVYREEVIA